MRPRPPISSPLAPYGRESRYARAPATSAPTAPPASQRSGRQAAVGGTRRNTSPAALQSRAKATAAARGSGSHDRRPSVTNGQRTPPTRHGHHRREMREGVESFKVERLLSVSCSRRARPTHSGSYAAGSIAPGLAACWFSPAERATRSDTGVPLASVGARAWRQGAWTARHLLVGAVRGRDGEKQPDGRTVDRRGGIAPLAYRLDGRGREVTVAGGGDHPDVRNRAVPLDDAREDDPPFAGVPARLPAELGLHAVKLDGGRQARLHGRVPSIDDGIGGLGLVEGAQVVDQRDADCLIMSGGR